MFISVASKPEYYHAARLITAEMKKKFFISALDVYLSLKNVNGLNLCMLRNC